MLLGNEILRKADQYRQRNLIVIPPGATRLSQREVPFRSYKEKVGIDANSVLTNLLAGPEKSPHFNLLHYHLFELQDQARKALLQNFLVPSTFQ